MFESNIRRFPLKFSERKEKFQNFVLKFYETWLNEVRDSNAAEMR